MNRILLPLLIVFSSTALAQKGEPCCSVVGINSANNSVIARDNGTGRLFAFKVDAMDIKAINLKDAVTINSDVRVVTALNGAARKYNAEPINDLKFNSSATGKGIVQINWGEPCCNIIQIDRLEPCCNVFTAKDKNTGTSLQFKAPALVLGTVKVGDPVYLEPCCSIAIVQSAYQGNEGQMNSFGYPIESGNGNSDDQASTKWVISPAPNMKGVLGRLNTSFPSDVEWTFEIRNGADNKFITSRSGFSNHGPSYDLGPSIYNFQFNSIMVENVPIERGKETRLKTGVLQIVSGGVWELYDESKEKLHTTGNKPKKFALPVGSYQLKLGGQFYPVVIKEGATVEY